MATVAIVVSCEAAGADRSYALDLEAAAEEYTVPLTWLIHASPADPMSNIKLYHTEYLHRIPSWHEIGLLAGFEGSHGHIEGERERIEAICLGKDLMKQCHVKPTCIRAVRDDLRATDLKQLESLGFIVAIAGPVEPCTGHVPGHPSPGAAPYHPSYQDINTEGDSSILVASVASGHGVCGDLQHGWAAIRPILEGAGPDAVVVLSVADTADRAADLREALGFCRARGDRFATATALAG